jgi:hypothetical protein
MRPIQDAVCKNPKDLAPKLRLQVLKHQVALLHMMHEQKHTIFTSVQGQIAQIRNDICERQEHGYVIYRDDCRRAGLTLPGQDSTVTQLQTPAKRGRGTH